MENVRNFARGLSSDERSQELQRMALGFLEVLNAGTEFSKELYLDAKPECYGTFLKAQERLLKMGKKVR